MEKPGFFKQQQQPRIVVGYIVMDYQMFMNGNQAIMKTHLFKGDGIAGLRIDAILLKERRTS